MLNTSIRRAALAVQPLPLASAVVCTGTRAAAAHTISYRTHQRRNSSSSKPSSPEDGSNGIAAGQAVATTPARKTATRGSKRKSPHDVAAECTVKGRDESVQNLPSVPSTHHLKSRDIAASAFFSLHRPLSVTSSFPKTVTTDVFASIFTPRTRANKSSEVINTLVNSIEELELGSEKSHPTRNLDGEPNPIMMFPHHIMKGKYHPFNPPPPPVPTSPENLMAAELEVAEGEMQRRTFTGVLTVEETTDVNGDVSYAAFSSTLAEVEEPNSATDMESPNDSVGSGFLDRMNSRRERYEEYRKQRAEDTGMIALSVKRQRKLKMKKHKYKKLMKRTRNLRRRLERG